MVLISCAVAGVGGGVAQRYATARGGDVVASSARLVAGAGVPDSRVPQLVTKGNVPWQLFLPEGLGGEGFDLLNEAEEAGAGKSDRAFYGVLSKEPPVYWGGLPLDVGFEVETVFWANVPTGMQRETFFSAPHLGLKAVFDVRKFTVATSGKVYLTRAFPDHETPVRVVRDGKSVPLTHSKAVLEFVAEPGGPNGVARPGGWSSAELLDNAAGLIQRLADGANRVPTEGGTAGPPIKAIFSEPEFVFPATMEDQAVNYFEQGPDPLTSLLAHYTSGDQLAGWYTFLAGAADNSRNRSGLSLWAMDFASQGTADYISTTIGARTSTRNVDRLMGVKEVALMRSYLAAVATQAVAAVVTEMEDNTGLRKNRTNAMLRHSIDVFRQQLSVDQRTYLDGHADEISRRLSWSLLNAEFLDDTLDEYRDLQGLSDDATVDALAMEFVGVKTVQQPVPPTEQEPAGVKTVEERVLFTLQEFLDTAFKNDPERRITQSMLMGHTTTVYDDLDRGSASNPGKALLLSELRHLGEHYLDLAGLRAGVQTVEQISQAADVVADAAVSIVGHPAVIAADIVATVAQQQGIASAADAARIRLGSWYFAGGSPLPARIVTTLGETTAGLTAQAEQATGADRADLGRAARLAQELWVSAALTPVEDRDGVLALADPTRDRGVLDVARTVPVPPGYVGLVLSSEGVVGGHSVDPEVLVTAVIQRLARPDLAGRSVYLVGHPSPAGAGTGMAALATLIASRLDPTLSVEVSPDSGPVTFTADGNPAELSTTSSRETTETPPSIFGTLRGGAADLRELHGNDELSDDDGEYDEESDSALTADEALDRAEDAGRVLAAAQAEFDQASGEQDTLRAQEALDDARVDYLNALAEIREDLEARFDDFSDFSDVPEDLRAAHEEISLNRAFAEWESNLSESYEQEPGQEILFTLSAPGQVPARHRQRVRDRLLNVPEHLQSDITLVSPELEMSIQDWVDQLAWMEASSGPDTTLADTTLTRLGGVGPATIDAANATAARIERAVETGIASEDALAGLAVIATTKVLQGHLPVYQATRTVAQAMIDSGASGRARTEAVRREQTSAAVEQFLSAAERVSAALEAGAEGIRTSHPQTGEVLSLGPDWDSWLDERGRVVLAPKGVLSENKERPDAEYLAADLARVWDISVWVELPDGGLNDGGWTRYGPERDESSGETTPIAGIVGDVDIPAQVAEVLRLRGGGDLAELVENDLAQGNNDPDDIRVLLGMLDNSLIRAIRTHAELAENEGAEHPETVEARADLVSEREDYLRLTGLMLDRVEGLQATPEERADLRVELEQVRAAVQQELDEDRTGAEEQESEGDQESEEERESEEDQESEEDYLGPADGYRGPERLADASPVVGSSSGVTSTGQGAPAPRPGEFVVESAQREALAGLGVQVAPVPTVGNGSSRRCWRRPSCRGSSCVLRPAVRAGFRTGRACRRRSRPRSPVAVRPMPRC